MGTHQTLEANSWNGLPDPLSARILQQAFTASGRSLSEWLRLSLVCREWRERMRTEPVDIRFASAVSSGQCAWLQATQVPVRVISFARPELGVSGPYTRPELVAAELTISDDILESSASSLEEAHNLHVARVPRHVTTLARFTALRRLSLLGAIELLPAEAEEMLASLPPTLISLQLELQTPIQGRSFACLPLLQELRIWASTETDTDMYDGAIEVDLAGLPASLQTVSVFARDTDALLDVRLAEGPPTAALLLDARTIELQAAHSRPTTSRALSTQLLELDTGALTLHCPAPGVEEHDLATTAGLQSCLAHYLVSWVTGCGAAAVQLRVKEDCVNGCFFDLNVMQSGIRGGLPLERQAAYRIGSMDLLNAIQGLCKRHKLRCVDVKGTGQVILFERVSCA